jgi:DNA primase
VPLPEGGAPPGLWDALAWLARREGFAVDRGDCRGGNSETRWSAHRTHITRDLDGPTAAQALLHELGHVLVHRSLADVPGATTGGCRGIRKVEADSIAFVVAARLGMDTSAYSWPDVASWAGSDPRARPEEAIQSAVLRITQAAATIIAHLDVALFGKPHEAAPIVLAEKRQPSADGEAAAERARGRQKPAARGADAASAVVAPGPFAGDAGPPPAVLSRILLDAERFYRARLCDSWVLGYLEMRGLGGAVLKRWRIGYAPGGWTALITYLRRIGYDDASIEAAGLARRSSRGTLIDHFRDRVMLAIRNEHGMIAGFLGRARPDAGPRVPKYLNSPETSAYRKGDLLFGLHEAHGHLARGVLPVIVEGPFDVIAVSTADPSRYAGLAPCGTALTSRQVAALASVGDVHRTGVLVALDGDRAGYQGIVKAHELLLAHTRKATAVVLPTGRDPAEILQHEGPLALCGTLQRPEPLARVVIDAHIDRWGRKLDHAEGRLGAMRSAAGLIARTLPAETVKEILRVTGGRTIMTLDEELRHIPNPELRGIAGIVPADSACQIVRVAERTGSDCSEVIAEVVNSATQSAHRPKHPAARRRKDDPGPVREAPESMKPAGLAAAAYPEAPSAALRRTTAVTQPVPKSVSARHAPTSRHSIAFR